MIRSLPPVSIHVSHVGNGVFWHPSAVQPDMIALDQQTSSRWHDDVIKWKHFPRDRPFVRGIHRWPVNSPHKGLWRGALMFSLICAWMDGWVYHRESGDLRCHSAHYDVKVMTENFLYMIKSCLSWPFQYRITDLMAQFLKLSKVGDWCLQFSVSQKIHLVLTEYIVDHRAFPRWPVIHGSSWSGLVKVGPIDMPRYLYREYANNSRTKF